MKAEPILVAAIEHLKRRRALLDEMIRQLENYQRLKEGASPIEAIATRVAHQSRVAAESVQ